MKICKDCGQEWQGKEYSRRFGNRIDYICECGSKKRPHNAYTAHLSSIIDTPAVKVKCFPNKRVMAIADWHAPFEHKDALDFVKWVYKKYDINEVIQGGDLLDNHYASYHESDPDGMSGGAELDAAVEHLRGLAEAFPDMKVCPGNHDRLSSRKAHSSGLSKRWIKTIKDVLLAEGLPVEGWQFAPEWIVDGVLFTHGDGAGNCWRRAQKEHRSRVQFHLHSQSYLYHYVDNRYNFFAAQVGALIDRDSYAMAYAKSGPEPVYSVFVMINGIPQMVTMREYYEELNERNP